MSLSKLMTRNPEMNTWAQLQAAEIVGRIASQHLIVKAYLFGSAVNGNFTADSDLDILIVVASPDDVRRLQAEVLQPRFADIAIDWIFQTESAFEIRKDLGGVCFEAHHHGLRLQ